MNIEVKRARERAKSKPAERARTASTHRHAGTAMHWPVDVHHGHATHIQDHRGRVLIPAYGAQPERFVRHPHVPLALPEGAWINRAVRQPVEMIPAPTSFTI